MKLSKTFLACERSEGTAERRDLRHTRARLERATNLRMARLGEDKRRRDARGGAFHLLPGSGAVGQMPIEVLKPEKFLGACCPEHWH